MQRGSILVAGGTAYFEKEDKPFDPEQLCEFRHDEFEHFFTRKLGNAFIGRDWLLEQLSSKLSSTASSSASSVSSSSSNSSTRIVLIKGDPGVGKSTLAASIVSAGFPNYDGEKKAVDIKQGSFSVLAYHVCMAENPETLSVPPFVRNVASMLCQTVPGYADLLKSSANVSKALDSANCEMNEC